MHAVVPDGGVLGILLNPVNQAAFANVQQDAQAAAAALGVQVRILEATNAGEIEAAFNATGAEKIAGMVVSSDPLFTAQRDQLVALAARTALPATYAFSEVAAAGGLMTYGTRLSDAYRLLAVYAAKVLSGAKPADLPVQQSMKVGLVINLTANALGLKIPLTLLGRADEVIE